MVLRQEPLIAAFVEHIFADFIALSITAALKDKVDGANLISALADGSTNAAIIDQEVVFVRQLDINPTGLHQVKISTNVVYRPLRERSLFSCQTPDTSSQDITEHEQGDKEKVLQEIYKHFEESSRSAGFMGNVDDAIVQYVVNIPAGPAF